MSSENLLVQGRYVISQALDTDHTCTSVLRSIDLLLNKGRCRLGGLLSGLLLDELIDGLLVVSLGLTETVNTAFQSVISGLTNVLIFGCHRRLETKEKLVKTLVDNLDFHLVGLKSRHIQGFIGFRGI